MPDFRFDCVLVKGFENEEGWLPAVVPEEGDLREGWGSDLFGAGLTSRLSQICFFLGGMSKVSVKPGLLDADGDAEAEAERGRFSCALSPKPVIWLKVKAGFADLGLAIDLLEDTPRPVLELRLPVAEWFGRIVDKLLDVSDEMTDNGRGMTVTFSTKSTLAGGASSTSFSGESGGVVALRLVADRDRGLEFCSFQACCCFISAGVDGALSATGFGGYAFVIAVKSMLEIAAERRCAWPLRPVPEALSPGPGGGSCGGGGIRLSAFVGLELGNPGLLGASATNSLPRLRWPPGLGGGGPLGLTAAGGREAPGLNENAGNGGAGPESSIFSDDIDEEGRCEEGGGVAGKTKGGLGSGGAAASLRCGFW